MKVGIDILGGDYAPEATVQGAILAHEELDGKATIVLIGDKEKINEECSKLSFDPDLFEIVHTADCISMEEYPAKAFSQKPNASIPLGFSLLKNNEIDGFASAGNTGAMLVGAMHIVKSVPGIIRPCISAHIPKNSEFPTILLDVGLNPDCKPDILYQYAILGSLYAEKVYNIKKPKVALFNLGQEEEKGNLLTKTTYQAMKGTKDFNFIGNIEGTDLFSEEVDVIVCDGFIGNTIIKEAEAFYSLIKKRNISDSFFEKFNYENHGGTPILGINAPALIGHGISGKHAIKNLILNMVSIIDSKLIEKIKEAFN